MKKAILILIVLGVLQACGTTERLYNGEKVISHGIKLKKGFTGHYFVVPDGDTIMVSPRDYNKYIINNQNK